MIELKAWEMERSLRDSALPDINYVSDWGNVRVLQDAYDMVIKSFWSSRVPGSGAPEHLIVGAVQAVENMGRDVSAAEMLLTIGMDALQSNDISLLREITSRIFYELELAPVLMKHPYHDFAHPMLWKEISADFPRKRYEFDRKVLEDKVYGGWIGQISGASMGTAIEGYMHENLVKVFGDRLGKFIKEPDTHNDDITYEIAFLLALEENGRSVSSDAVAMKWISYIPFGWSAEYIAMENIKRGVFPPLSGSFFNPFREWIGAQMRCMVEGFVAPADPYEAARVAYLDAIISHSSNGVYGGIHSAVLTSLAFALDDPREIVLESLKYIPRKTEFRCVVEDVVKWCKNSNSWLDVYEQVRERFLRYNWIHLYPNTASVITSLWFGDGDFDRTMEIVASFGYDVDCNAGEVGSVLGAMLGLGGIDIGWYEHFGDILNTYMDGMESISIYEFLVKKTLRCIELLES